MNEDLKTYTKLLEDLEQLGLHISVILLDKIKSIENLFYKNDKDLQAVENISNQQTIFANAAILALETASSKTKALLAEHFENSDEYETSQNTTGHQLYDNATLVIDITEPNTITTQDTSIPTITGFDITRAVGNESTMVSLHVPSELVGIPGNNARKEITTEEIITENDILNSYTNTNTEHITSTDIIAVQAVTNMMIPEMSEEVAEYTELSGEQELNVSTEAVHGLLGVTTTDPTTTELDFAEEMRLMEHELLHRNNVTRISKHIVPDMNNELPEDVDEGNNIPVGIDTIGGFIVENKQEEEDDREEAAMEIIQNFVDMEISTEESGDGFLETEYDGLINDTIADFEGSGGSGEHDIRIENDYIDMEEYILVP